MGIKLIIFNNSGIRVGNLRMLPTTFVYVLSNLLDPKSLEDRLMPGTS